MRIEWKAAGCATLGLIGIFAAVGIVAVVFYAGYLKYLVAGIVIGGTWGALYLLSKEENDEGWC